LALRAETVFAGLTKNGTDPAMDKAFQRLFTRLVTPGESQEDTRRVVERAELGDEVWGLAQRLAGEENRLVVTNASSARETAEVVHEALIRHWPKLKDWIDRDRDFQSWLRQIKSNIELWAADPTDEGPLLRGRTLAQATDWLAKRRDDLSQKERADIEASVALNARLEAEKAAARQAEVKSQQELAKALAQAHQVRPVKAAVGVLIALIVVGLAYAVWLNQAFLKVRIVMLAEIFWPKVLTVAAERALAPKNVFKECANCPEMVVVPAGEFMMGSPANEKDRNSNESPQHKVTIARLRDFLHGFDLIDLSAIDANSSSKAKGDQAFVFGVAEAAQFCGGARWVAASVCASASPSSGNAAPQFSCDSSSPRGA
jgi:hypothetical protein